MERCGGPILRGGRRAGEVATTLLLLTIGAILLLAPLVELGAKRFGVPQVCLLTLLGVVLGPMALAVLDGLEGGHVGAESFVHAARELGGSIGLGGVLGVLMAEEVWSGPQQVYPIQHHPFQQEPDGTCVMLRHGVDADYPGLDLSTVVQIDASLDTVWSWDPYEQLDALEVEPTAQGDAMHGNSVTLDGDHVYVNSRNRNRLFKVSWATGEVLGALGRDGDFAGDPTATAPWFRSQHEPELQADGSGLFYDNGGRAGEHTRVVQLAIDEESLTTEVVWEFPGTYQVDPWYTHEWFSGIWGDADRLPNGHVLVTAGTRADGHQSRVFEVTPDRQVVWELLLPAGVGEDVVGTYRAERSDPSGLESLLP